MKENLKKKISKSSTLPGVYIFKSNTGEIIYVGKAKNLKSRLTSYTLDGLGPKTKQMVSLAASVETIEVNSELEALLLEAQLVRKHMPKYNIQLKDDKTPIYIIVTKEKFPRVITARKTQLQNITIKEIFGPFTSGLVAKRILKRIRKVFPFSQHKISSKACIYSQIGLCNPCPNVISNVEDEKKYSKNISMVIKTLEGKLTKVKVELESEMNKYSEVQNYEEASRAKSQLTELDYFTRSFERGEGYIENPNLLSDIRGREEKNLISIISEFIDIKEISRIECFDVAHMAGTFPTASMVTFINGEPEKKYYRHFSVKTTLGGDTDRLSEVFRRRRGHFDDWGVPDIIIVDGGKPQVTAAMKSLENTVPVIGLAKRYETLVFSKDNKFFERRLPNSPAKNLVQRLRDEAHRFARRYHHKLVAKAMTKKII